MILMATAWPVRRSTLGYSMSIGRRRREGKTYPLYTFPKLPPPKSGQNCRNRYWVLEQTYAVLSRVERFGVHASTASTDIRSRHGSTTSVGPGRSIFEPVDLINVGSELFQVDSGNMSAPD